MLQSLASQRVGHDRETELNLTKVYAVIVLSKNVTCIFSFSSSQYNMQLDSFVSVLI